MLARTLRSVSSVASRRAPSAVSLLARGPARHFSSPKDNIVDAEYTEVTGSGSAAASGGNSNPNSINFDIEVAVKIRSDIVDTLRSENVKGLLETLAQSSDLPLAKWRTVESVMNQVTEQIIADYQTKEPSFPLQGPPAVAASNFDTLCRVVALSEDGAPLREAWEEQWAALLSSAYGTDEYVTRNAKIAPEAAQRMGYMYKQFTQHETFKSMLAERLNEQAIAQSGPTASGAVRSLEQKQRTRALISVLDPFLTRLYKQFGFEGPDCTCTKALQRKQRYLTKM